MSQGKNAQVQKRGKSWQYRIQYFTEEGKRESVSRSGYATRKEAKEAGDKVASELSSNKIIPEVVKDNPSTKEFYEFWLESYCSSNVKESTRRGYVKNLKNLIYPYIKEIPLRELNAATLQNLLDILLEKGYALNRIRAVKGMFTGGLDFAVRMQLIAVNPAKSIRMPNVRKVMESSPESIPKERRPIAEWEWEVIIGRYPEGVSAHFPLICGYRLGNRLGEAFGYTWDDVNWSRRSISVNRQVVDKVHTDENGCHWYIALPKYESMREIELDDATYELLLRMKLKWEKSKKWMQEVGYDYPRYYMDEEKTVREVYAKDIVPETWKVLDFINVRPENGTYATPRILQNVSRVIHGKANGKGVDDKMGIAIPDFCYHALRHTHGTALVEAGADYKYIMERMGHKNIETTMNIYVHSTDRLRNQERSKLNNLYKK